MISGRDFKLGDPGIIGVIRVAAIHLDGRTGRKVPENGKRGGIRRLWEIEFAAVNVAGLSREEIAGNRIGIAPILG
jgi:hypothetical protein